MKAWTLTKFGSSPEGFQLLEVDKPVPSGGEVLVRVTHFGLNFADVMAMQGLYRDCPPLPSVLGYDIAGVVEAVGEGVRTLKPGDRVAGMSRFGGYAEYAVTPEAGLAKLPASMTEEVGIALATQGITAAFMAWYLQPLRKGERVLIHAAAGGVGNLLVQMASRVGCEIFGTAGSQEKLDKLAALGVHHPINYREEDFSAHIQQHFGGPGLDVIFDPVGGKSVKDGMKLLRPGGRMIAFGGSSFIGKGGMIAKLRNFIQFGFYHPLILIGSSKTLAGVNMLRIADHRPEAISECLDWILQAANNGNLVPDIFRVFDAAELKEAISLLQHRQTTGKVVLAW